MPAWRVSSVLSTRRHLTWCSVQPSHLVQCTAISPGAVYSHLTWCSVQPSHLVQCTAISPGAVYSSSRHARRLSSVFSTPTESSLLPVVALDSSEARMPLPRCARKVCGCGCRISEKPVTRRALRVNFLPLVASDKRKAIARTTQLQWR